MIGALIYILSSYLSMHFRVFVSVGTAHGLDW